MPKQKELDIFLVCIPGLERLLEAEAREAGLTVTGHEAGGVSLTGTWLDVWRANLELRGASRVLVRWATFRASHLSELDKRARTVDWAGLLRRDIPVTVETACRRSRIYHSGAASQRIATAITEEHGAALAREGGIALKARIDRDICTISVDTSGGLLHKRGSKQAMAKAPLRETMAALLLRACGFTGTEPVYDPMCGSGTFVIEAAEWSTGLKPGRHRSFSFEQLAMFDAREWQALKEEKAVPRAEGLLFHGSDRDAGAVAASQANAERAGVAAQTNFRRVAVSDIAAPPGSAGLVMINPPYGLRIGDRKPLMDLYATLGRVLRERFTGWRVGLFTPDEGLARETGLSFVGRPLPVLHGGLRVKLWKTAQLR